MIRLRNPAPRPRLAVASRTIAGTLGAYGLTSLITVALSLLLARAGIARPEAVIAATLASFVVFAAIAMAVFHAASVTRAWLWLIGAALPMGLAAYFLS